MDFHRLLQSGYGRNYSKHQCKQDTLAWGISVFDHPKHCFGPVSCVFVFDDVIVFRCDYSCVISTWRLFTGAALQQADTVNPLCFCVQMSCFVYLWLSLICCVCVLMLSWVTVCSLLSRGEREHQEKLFSKSPAGIHVPKPTADRINWQCYCELDT